MKYIDTWLSGLGLEYVIPKLKSNGITTPKKLAALSLREIYEVVGIEDSEDRKKLFFLIQRLQTILQNKQDNSGHYESTSANVEENVPEKLLNFEKEERLAVKSKDMLQENTLHGETSNKVASTMEVDVSRKGKENFQENRRVRSEKANIIKLDPNPNDKKNLLDRSLRLLSAHKVAIAGMVEVLKDEMDLVQAMENVDDRKTELYLEQLEKIIATKTKSTERLMEEVQSFLRFRSVCN